LAGCQKAKLIKTLWVLKEGVQASASEEAQRRGLHPVFQKKTSFFYKLCPLSKSKAYQNPKGF
jgi:hypothetical protein